MTKKNYVPPQIPLDSTGFIRSDLKMSQNTCTEKHVESVVQIDNKFWSGGSHRMRSGMNSMEHICLTFVATECA